MTMKTFNFMNLKTKDERDAMHEQVRIAFNKAMQHLAIERRININDNESDQN